MRPSRNRPIAIASLDDLLQSFLIDIPADYRIEAARIQVYPLSYFLPFLRIPTPPNVAPFSYLILQKSGKGVVRVNADQIEILERAAMFMHQGSVVSLRALDPATAGWLITYDNSVLARALDARTVERLLELRSPIALTRETVEWIDALCALLEPQARSETSDHQPVSEYLFGAVIERLLAETVKAGRERVNRADAVSREFRRLVFEHALREGAVGFYAGKLSVSENYLLRCVRGSTGRSPKEWILDMRLMHAQRLLRTTDAPVAEIATQTGFDDPSYFSRLFQRRFSMTPRRFRTMLEENE